MLPIPCVASVRIMFEIKRISRRDFIRQGALGIGTVSGITTAGIETAGAGWPPGRPAAVPDKVVVLSFDDAPKSHRTFVAPSLKDLGFRATFFVTHAWMLDSANFMTWDEIAEIHKMGFEIGNHTWTHDNFSIPRNAWRLAGELALVERQLAKVGIGKPVSFAYPGDDFGPEALKVLQELGYNFARRGMEPEIPYGEMRLGPLYDPKVHHPLLIPTTGDAYPNWDLEYFQRVVAAARGGKIVILQFHGVPDPVHPWVYTPPENFRKYMRFLKENGFRGIALEDLREFVDMEEPPSDPTARVRYPQAEGGCSDLPAEVRATRADLPFWLENMLRFHRYTLTEAAEVCGLSEAQVKEKAAASGLYPPAPAPPPGENGIRVLPYPGGRSPRIGFKEGQIDPLRGTKVSVFLPWALESYVVIDLPEAVFCDLGLIFLAHTDIPTIWNDRNIVFENIDWTRDGEGGLSHQRTLPDGITIGASVRAVDQHVEMELWLRNFGGKDLVGTRPGHDRKGQVCVMLKGAEGFNQQTNGNKLFRPNVAAVHSADGKHWILTAWEHSARVWGNPFVPCMHADPALPECPFGQTVRARGRLWFYEGAEIEEEMRRVNSYFISMASPS